MDICLQDRQAQIPLKMQDTLNSIQKLIGPRKPTYKSYYIGKYSLLDPYSDHHKIQPRDDIDRYSQRICPLQSQ
jgi:hypothetical protein